MSYGTRGGRRKPSGQDPTIIPSTQPIGFLSKLPWKMGGTLRYKPSAADLQEHPGKSGTTAEDEPLLGSDSSSDFGEVVAPTRKRSGTTGSGETSDSFRSRGDLFPSDGEGDEDAVPLDDEVTYDMIRKDDKSSGKTRSSKGKRPAFGGSRTVSRTTIASSDSRGSPELMRMSSASLPRTPDIENVPSLEDLAQEEERLRQEEDQKITTRKEAARLLAVQKGLNAVSPDLPPVQALKPDVAEDEVYEAELPLQAQPQSQPQVFNPDSSSASKQPSTSSSSDDFVPARLPYFG
jgi:hypothetical protein